MTESVIFHVFVRTLSQSPFWEDKVAKLPSTMFLEQVLLPAGSKMSPLGSHFRPKGVKKVTTPNSTTPPGVDLVAIWRRERPIKHFGTILDPILVPNGPNM